VTYPGLAHPVLEIASGFFVRDLRKSLYLKENELKIKGLNQVAI